MCFAALEPCPWHASVGLGQAQGQCLVGHWSLNLTLPHQIHTRTYTKLKSQAPQARLQHLAASGTVTCLVLPAPLWLGGAPASAPLPLTSNVGLGGAGFQLVTLCPLKTQVVYKGGPYHWGSMMPHTVACVMDMSASTHLCPSD